MKRNKIKFPVIEHIRLHNFSLYKRTPNVDLKLAGGVFCLVGANGLGKTTFLATVNYGLTGVVPNPVDRSDSNDYMDHNYVERSTTKKFFEGRITAQDKSNASVELVLKIGDYRFTIKRLIVNGQNPVYLQVINLESGEVEYEGKEDARGRNEEMYHKYICLSMGISRFKQFLFLQHFVLTFDEHRKLLLWDHVALNEALHLCIGANYDNALEASNLVTEMAAAGSLARNYQFQASNVTTRIAAIQKEFAQEEYSEEALTPQEIEAQYRELLEKADKIKEQIRDNQNTLRDFDAQWIEKSTKLLDIQKQLDEHLTRQISSKTQVINSYYISESVSNNLCVVCHASGAASIILGKIEQCRCPLCDKPIPMQQIHNNENFSVGKIEVGLNQAREQLKQIVLSKEKTNKLITRLEKEEQFNSGQLKVFEKKNAQMLSTIKEFEANEMFARLTRLRLEYDELQAQKDEQYAIRGEKHKQLKALQEELSKTYDAAEQQFIPLFQKLAHAFLGLDVNIKTENRTSFSKFRLNLVLKLADSQRRDASQLSESQKFFLDIALRMALVQYISANSSKATLLIDTPEGSLDIAYEGRAGDMFAQFIKSGHGMLMTANINTSFLLKELAFGCGKKHLTLHLMTNWSELSTVQTKAEPKFREAYKEIEQHQSKAGF